MTTENQFKVGQHTSVFRHIKAGVPQGTLCGPVAFLTYISDLQTCCNILKYVDHCSIWEVCADDGHDNKIQQATDEAVEWSPNNLRKINTDKTREMVINFSKLRPTPATVFVNRLESYSVC